MSNLPWILPLTMFGIAAIGYIISGGFLLRAAHQLNSRRVFVESDSLYGEGVLSKIDKFSGDALEGQALLDAIMALYVNSRTLKPDWIVGVHPGGRLLSVVIARMIGLPPSRCVFVSTDRSRSPYGFAFTPDLNRLTNRVDGTMLIIDDVSRSGRTLRNLKTFLRDRYYSRNFFIRRAYFAVLLIVSEVAGNFRFRPDWACFRSDNPQIVLPWSQLSAAVAQAYAARADGGRFDQDAIDEYERIIHDFDFALEKACTFLPWQLAEMLRSPEAREGKGVHSLTRAA